MADNQDIRTILREEIARKGVIPFSQFMETALYCPEIGYYERAEGRIGGAGDYYTSVSVGSLFGELLAFQFAEWLQEHGDAPVQMVEAGAHDGRLALDLLEALRQRETPFWERFEYWIVEPSHERQKWQARKLDKFAAQVRWWPRIEALPAVRGVIFSNELLDAMPVRRYGWDAASKEWFEWGVGVGSPKLQVPSSSEFQEFAWATMPADSDYVRRRFVDYGIRLTPEMEAVLPDGYTIELSLAAAAWWYAAARKLKAGRLLTFDYGFSGDEFLVPERTGGTVRGYSRHGVMDALADPGNQDITAHVNFTQLQLEGQRAELKTATYESQRAFLTRIAGRREIRAGEARQFQTLTHPEHLGDKFRVLVQERGDCGGPTLNSC